MKEKRVSFNEIRNNTFKSTILILFFLGLMGAIGVILGLYWGNIWTGVITAVIIASIYAIIAYFSGKSMILSLTKAKQVSKKTHPHLVNAVEGLSIAAGIPVPTIHVIDDSALNAFATGRKPEEGAVVFTSGILAKLNREELEGVIAHELAHIKYRDIRTMMIAAVITGVIVLLSDIMLRSVLYGGDRKNNGGIVFIVIGIALAILSPIIGEMIRLTISRKREYAADAGAVVFTRYPQGLANALRKISKDPDPLVDTANKATAHLFISTPFRKRKGAMTRLFSTHPPIEDRIARLESM